MKTPHPHHPIPSLHPSYARFGVVNDPENNPDILYYPEIDLRFRPLENPTIEEASHHLSVMSFHTGVLRAQNCFKRRMIEFINSL